MFGSKPAYLAEDVSEDADNRYIDVQEQSQDERSDWNTFPKPKKQLQPPATIIALDLNEIQPISGVQTLQLSFLDPRAEQVIAGMIAAPRRGFKLTSLEFDLILSDMSPRITGNNIHDTEAAMHLCEKTFEFACKYLRKADENRGVGKTLGGALV
jgi:23S rRNA U2552 (ribose-2'-O)-methylase RlmE/FtsJ